MLRSTTLIICMALTLCTASTLSAEFSWHPKDCERIKDGTIFTSDGEIIETGFDTWGYNYQTHQFVGGYCDAYDDAAWCQPFADVILYLKWNDAWLSNKDCDGDGVLDRHYGHDSYIGSGAQVINVQKYTYIDDFGQKQRETAYYKIKAAPYRAHLIEDVWYKPNGKVLGPAIWNDFYIARKYIRTTVKEPPAPNGLSVQSMTMEAPTAETTALIDPFSVDFDQFTPQN